MFEIGDVVRWNHHSERFELGVISIKNAQSFSGVVLYSVDKQYPIGSKHYGFSSSAFTRIDHPERPIITVDLSDL